MSGFMVGPYFWGKNSTASSGEASWSSNSTTSAYTMSMNSLSFCLLATAILIMMFMAMVIFERLLCSTQPSESPPITAAPAREELRAYSAKRIDCSRPYVTDYSTFDLSVLMPGRLCPTHLAKPAPLPCPREGMRWPSQPPRALSSASSPKSQSTL